MKSKKAISGIILSAVIASQVSMIPFNQPTYAVEKIKANEKIEKNICYNELKNLAITINDAISKTSSDDEKETKIEEVRNKIVKTLGDEVIFSPEIKIANKIEIDEPQNLETEITRKIESSELVIDEEPKLEENSIIEIDNGAEIKSYQWYKDGVEIEGKTEKDLILSNISEENEGIYTLKVTAMLEDEEKIYEESYSLMVATFTAKMIQKPEYINPGDTFEVTLRIENIKNVEKGITCLAGKINFDQNYLEEVEIIEGEGWSKGNRVNEETLKFVTDNDIAMTEASDIFKIKFKVKENLEITDKLVTTISIGNIEASDAEIDIKAKDTSIDVEISKKPEDSLTSKTYKVEENYITRINAETTIGEFIEKIETNTEPKFLEANGNEILDKNELVKTGTQIKAGKLEFKLVVRGDINGDGKIGMTDLANLKEHYLEIELLTGAKLKAADMNFNDEITVTDLAQIKEILVGK